MSSIDNHTTDTNQSTAEEGQESGLFIFVKRLATWLLIGLVVIIVAIVIILVAD